MQKQRAHEEAEQIDQQQDDSGVRGNLDPNGLEPFDYWTVTSELIIRHHLRPRTDLFVPSDSDSPIPIKYIDVLRSTSTDLDDYKEKSIQDIWSIDKDKKLSGQWTGRTTFTLLKSKPPPGFKWVEGRLTKIQKSKRPDSIRPEEWPHLSRKDQLREIALWQEEGPKRQQARDARARHYIEEAEVDEYTKILAKAKEEFGIPIASAMPCCGYMMKAKIKQLEDELDATGSISEALDDTNPSDRGDSIRNWKQRTLWPNKDAARSHQDKIGESSTASIFFFAMVHKPIPLPKAMKIPAARAAIDKEWDKLEKVPAWDLKKVKSWKEVVKEAKSKGITAHRGSLMQLCHLKNAELDEKYQAFKGRVVFRGDYVKDEEGFLAVFSEQGASSAHMTQTKFLDAIAHLPGCAGEDADAVGAYHQIMLKEADRLLGKGALPQTWISLPPHRQPKSWAGIEDPVVPLECNLYGHPLAGLLWDKGSQERIIGCGFEKIKGWESLYVHREKQIFLGVYVDDFHMAGRAENLAPMWAKLRKTMDIDEAVPFHNNTYLGCTQVDVPVDEKMMQSKRDLIATIMTRKDTLSSSMIQSAGELALGDIPTLTQKKKKNVIIKAKATAAQSKHTAKAWEYQMHGAAEKCVERYLELAEKTHKDLKKFTTPCIDDHQLDPCDGLKRGEMKEECAKIVLKALYCARMNRTDLLWTVNSLAREVTRWNVNCDKRLHRLVCYMHSTIDMQMECWVGDDPKDCQLALFADASFVSWLGDSKSTSGAILLLMGPNT